MCCILSMNLKGFFHDFNPSKCVVYFALLIFSILLGLRLDEVVTWNFFIVFIPLWLWKLLVFSGVTVGAIVWVKHPEYRRETNVELQAMMIASCFHLLLMLFEVLMCMNLQYSIASYRVVFIPMYFMSFMAIVGCVWGYRHERQLELETFFSINVLQFICLSLKWDSVISWSWVVVFVPLWIILTLLSVCVLYYIIWALLFMRSPEITNTQRNGHLVNSFMSCFIVIPLLTFMIMLVRQLDRYSVNAHYTTTFIPLQISLVSLIVTSFYQKGGNQWWFGMRKDFCEFLLDAIPFLREYGNISYKFSDTVVADANESDGSSSSIELSNTQESSKIREANKPVASVLVLDIPD
eukprot:TCONS_00007870-protein